MIPSRNWAEYSISTWRYVHCSETEVVLTPFKLILIFFLYYLQPKVVTATDEADLARRMERAEAENAEIDGDEDEEEDGLKYDGPQSDDDNDNAAGGEEEAEK